MQRPRTTGADRATGFDMMRPVTVTIALVIALAIASATARADVPYGEESVARGRALFLANCTQCHGNDGKSQVDVIADATDLTEPALYRNGTADADIERSIREGAGVGMPAWGPVLNSEENIGHLRNFIRSLWPPDQRPAAGK